MDKNLINIDDLFRQRLGGGEEEEKDGAWSNMSKLLDKEMPKRPVAGLWWRRMLTYTAGALLLVSTGVGSYEVVTAHRATAEGTSIANTGSGSNNANNGVSNNNGTSSISVSEKVAADNNTIGTTTITDNANHAGATTDAITSTAHSATIPQDTKVTATVALGTAATKAAGKHVSKTTHNSIASPSGAIPTSSNTLAGNVNSTSNNVANHTAKKHSNHTSAVATSTSVVSTQTQLIAATNNTGNTKTTGSTLASNTQIGATSTASITGKHKKAKSKTILPATTIGSSLIASASKLQPIDNGGLITETQRIDKVEVVQRNVTKPGDRNGRYVNDTIDKSEVSMNRYVQAASTPGATELQPVSVATVTNSAGNIAGAQNTNTGKVQNGAPTNILLASAAKSTASSSNAGMVGTHTHKKSGMLSNFAEMILDFRTNLGNAKFAPGITGGINATFFAPNGISGFQLGITGNFILNDNWSFLAELKYFSRFSGNSTISDNYVTYSARANGGYNKDSVQQNFKYNNLQSLELPFAIQYSIGKLGMYGGMNLVYNFSIYNDFQKNPYSSEITSQPGKSITPQYNSVDFASRFGLGYLVGASYSITPQLRVDARLAQTFWDNSSTSGGQLISNNLYKHPSLQLSIGYNFKKKENRMP